MTETLIISLVLTVDDGQLQGVQVQTGGVILPTMGVNACQAATEHYRTLLIETEVLRRMAEAQAVAEDGE